MYSKDCAGRLRRTKLRLFHSIHAIMMKHSALCSSTTCKNLEIKLVKSPGRGWARSWTQLRFLHTPSTSTQPYTTCKISLGWALHWLHKSEGTICLQSKLSMVSRELLQARYVKCFTLWGTHSVQIPLQKDLWGIGLELLGLVAEALEANNL